MIPGLQGLEGSAATARVTRAALAALALAVALAHVAYLPATLEDIDSVNFALGIRDFDVAKHRPHPPGYPVYIALGKTAVAAARPFSGRASESAIEARTLAVLSLIAARDRDSAAVSHVVVLVERAHGRGQ